MEQEIDILIGDLKQRKASACRQLLSDYGPVVLRMVSRIVTRREDAEEVYQDVFMKALRGIAGYKPQQASLSTWLSRIAYNESLNFLKGQKATYVYMDDLGLGMQDEPDEVPHNEETLAQLEQAFGMLPPHEQAIIRRAVSGTRILRQYDCITYQAYGLKGATRFPIEMNVAGATDVIIQHGINDIIHPVGTDVNPFRPWSDLPTVEEMQQGVEDIYVKPAKAMGLKVWSGTLLPIYGWRTYNEQRDLMRQQFNEWLRTSPIFDGCIDFDAAVRSNANPKAFADGFDSGDHLHPSERAYEAMAQAAAHVLLTE